MWSRDADPVALIEAVDEVWTMTSLLGFEALLAGQAGHLPRRAVLRRLGPDHAISARCLPAATARPGWPGWPMPR